MHKRILVMNSTQRLNQRRKRLFKKNPYCVHCGVKMILPEEIGYINQSNNRRKLKSYPDNLCTIDHIFSKVHPLKISGELKKGKTIICCSKCNNRKGNEDVQKLGIEEIRKRASHAN